MRDKITDDPPVSKLKYEVEAKPPATAKKVLSFAQAVLTANRVSLDVLNRRMNTCLSCDFVRFDADSSGTWCVLCGCAMSRSEKAVKNLAAYEENLPTQPGYNQLLATWGCKHPERPKKGWQP